MIKEKKWLGLVIIIVVNVTRWLWFNISLSQFQANDSFLDAILTILNIKERAADGQLGEAQPRTTAAGAILLNPKESTRNKKLNHDAFDTFLNVIIDTIDVNISMAYSSFIFGINSHCMDNCDGGNNFARKKFVVLGRRIRVGAGKQQQTVIMTIVATVKGGLNEISNPTPHCILSTSTEKPETKIKKYDNYSQFYIALFDVLIEFLFVLFVLILILILLIMVMASLKLILIETFHCQDLQLFQIRRDGNKYHYYLQLIEMKMKIGDNILDVTITIFIAFALKMLIFFNTREEEGGDEQERALSESERLEKQQHGRSQSITTAATSVAGASISAKKETERNKKLCI